ncbi:hypothetical protein ACU8V3_14285 [Cobetia marina]
MSNDDKHDVLSLFGWRRDFALLLRELEMETFWLSTSRLLARHIEFNTWVALVFHRDRPPTILADSDDDDGADETLFKDYQKGLYLLDPFYVAARSSSSCALVTLDDVRQSSSLRPSITSAISSATSLQMKSSSTSH